MKVCLINPPMLRPRRGDVDVCQPLGLAYLAAVLKEWSGYDVAIVDALGLAWKRVNRWDEDRLYLGLSYGELFKEIEKFRPDMVGISIPFSTQSSSAYRLMRLLKDNLPDVVTVVGGPHASVRPMECLSHGADFAVIGEGEQTICELARKIEDGDENFYDVKGIAFKRRGTELETTATRPPISDLSILPFPARYLLPMENYFEAAKERYATMITSRGCPYRCFFCSIHSTMGRLWRPRSPQNVVDEIEHLIEEYQIRKIYFEDDNISLDRERMARICDLIIKRGLNIRWDLRNGVRADRLNEELLSKMKNAGCKRLCVAPESGDQQVVDKIVRKNLDLVDVEKAVRLSHKAGIIVDAFFVVGLVGEDKTTMRRSLDFAHKLRMEGLRHSFFFIAQPYYGTDLYANAKEKGYLMKDGMNLELGILDGEALIKTPQLAPEDVTSSRLEALKEEARDYLNPRYLFSQVHGLLHSKREIVSLASSFFSSYFQRKTLAETAEDVRSQGS